MNQNIEFRDMEELKYKAVTAAIEKKEESEGRLQVTFYGSIFGNIDSYGDIVEKGAFAETLKEDGERVRFCYAHYMNDVIGRIDSMVEDEKGLLVTATLSKEGKGKEVAELIEMGAITEFSIGYRTTKYEREEMDNGDVITHLTEIKLYEISAVPRAANELATVVSTQMKAKLTVGGLQNLTEEELTALKTAVDAEIDNRILTFIN